MALSMTSIEFVGARYSVCYDACSRTLELTHDEWGPQMGYTVDRGHPSLVGLALRPDEIVVKDYGGWEGLAARLQDAGAVEIVKGPIAIGYGHGQVCRINSE